MKQLLICVLIVLGFAACGGGGGASGPSGAAGLLPAASNGTATTAASSGVMSASGTVEGISGTVFLLNSGSPHGEIDVSITSSTTITGGTLAVGETVSVSGTGSWSTSIAATSIQISSPITAAAPAPSLGPVIPVASGVVSTSGTVVSVSSTAMLLNQGEPHGDIDVSIPATALQIGTPAVGDHALVTGSGTVSTKLTATVISYYASAPASTTVSGTIGAGTSYGFMLNTGSTSLPIVVTPATVLGGATLQTGASAQVTGAGTATTEINAVQVVVTDPTPDVPATPTPGPIAQTHILTADYLAGMYGTTSVPYATAAKYLTWAQTTGADSSAIRATGIKTMLYTDPNRVQTTDPMYTSNAATFATDCSGNRITVQYAGITQYVMNLYSSALGTLYQKTIQNESSGTTFDAVFEDNVGPLELAGVTDMPCNYTDASWDTGEETLATYSPYPVIFNGLSLFSGHNPSPTISMVNAPNTLGGILEGCYADDNSAEYDGWAWTAVENSELEVAADNSMFVCLARDTNAAAENTASRIYALASFLLTYNPSTSVLWEEYSTPSGLHVYPEEQLVALDPTTPAPSSVSGLQTSSGVYGRQFGACYIAGAFVGPCAVAVNPGNANETFPYPQYQHSLAISGAGVVDGGVVSATGAAPPTYLAPETAVVAFP